MFIFGLAYFCKLQPAKQHFTSPIMSAVSFSDIYPTHRNRTETQTTISKSITCGAGSEPQAITALHSFTALRGRASHQPVTVGKNWLGSHASITFIIHVFSLRRYQPLREQTLEQCTPALQPAEHHLLSLLKRCEDHRTDAVFTLKVCAGLCFQHDAIAAHYLPQ